MKTKELLKANQKKILLAFLIFILLVGMVVGIVTLSNQFRASSEAVLNSLDYDAANVADDEWTARY